MNKLLKNKILLFRLCIRRDPDAFGKVYDEYINRIYRFIYFKVSREEEAQDLASETFLRAWQHIQEGKDIKQLSAFLYSIARNLVIDHYRKKMITVSAEEADISGILTDEGKQKMKVEGTQEYAALLAAMNKMKEEYREVVQLRYIDELSIGEIAEILGKNKGNVRVTLHRASKTLRDVYNQNK